MIKFLDLVKSICYIVVAIAIIGIIGTAGAVDLDNIGAGQFIIQVVGFILAGASFGLIGWVCSVAASNLRYKYLAEQRKLRKKTNLNLY